MKPRIHQVLLDFDGVLAHYRHEVRIAHLATHAGCEHEHVRSVLFVSGLETEYDSGAIDTATYLRRLGDGIGAELRRPLGVSIVGGLLLSQLVTLYTTPVIYLYLERINDWLARRRQPEPVAAASTP